MSDVHEKVCRSCNLNKPISEFQSANTKSKPPSYCNTCRRTSARLCYYKNKEKWLKRSQSYQKETKYLHQKRWLAEHPEQNAIRAKILRLKKKGELISPGACEFCAAETKLVIHANSLTDPHDITWMCRTCCSKKVWQFTKG